jgi:hypothetical protein
VHEWAALLFRIQLVGHAFGAVGWDTELLVVTLVTVVEPVIVMVMLVVVIIIVRST